MIDFRFEAIKHLIQPLSSMIRIVVTAASVECVDTIPNTRGPVAPTALYVTARTIPKESRGWDFTLAEVKYNTHIEKISDEVEKWRTQYIQKYGIAPSFNLEVISLEK